MNKIIITSIVASLCLIGCGGSVDNPQQFTYKTLKNGIYYAPKSSHYPNTQNYSATLEITDNSITFTVEGYEPIVTAKQWVSDVEFDGANARLIIDPSEVNQNGYQVYLDREGYEWYTRVYSNWRYWEVK